MNLVFWLNYIAQKARTSYKSMCFRVLRGLSHLEFDVKSDVLQFKNIVIPWNKTKSAIKKWTPPHVPFQGGNRVYVSYPLPRGRGIELNEPDSDKPIVIVDHMTNKYTRFFAVCIFWAWIWIIWLVYLVCELLWFAIIKIRTNQFSSQQSYITVALISNCCIVRWLNKRLMLCYFCAEHSLYNLYT